MLIFRSVDDVRQAMYATERVHNGVVGTVSRASAGDHSPRKGTSYTASDAGARRWVLATFVEAMVFGYELSTRPLTLAEKDFLYDDMLVLAMLFGVSGEFASWDSWSDFETWFRFVVDQRHRVDGGTGNLVASNTFRGLSRDIYVAKVKLSWAFPAMGAETVPEPWNEVVPIRKGLWTWLVVRTLLCLARLADRLRPPRIRYRTEYLDAARRLKLDPAVMQKRFSVG